MEKTILKCPCSLKTNGDDDCFNKISIIIMRFKLSSSNNST